MRLVSSSPARLLMPDGMILYHSINSRLCHYISVKAQASRFYIGALRSLIRGTYPLPSKRCPLALDYTRRVASRHLRKSITTWKDLAVPGCTRTR